MVKPTPWTRCRRDSVVIEAAPWLSHDSAVQRRAVIIVNVEAIGEASQSRQECGQIGPTGPLGRGRSSIQMTRR